VVHDLRLELVLEPGAGVPAPAGFVRRYAPNGSRALATVAAADAGAAVAWADGLRRAGVVEEFSLAPATLEDVYIELVGRADALANGEGSDALAA
jgi:ABC-2 type transport system ATP-binding protein